MKSISGGVWSAAPTPLKSNLELDKISIQRQVEQHIQMGLSGMFIGGTSGEGPWLSKAQLLELAQICASASAGRISIALQVTDNSAPRMIEFMQQAADTGVDMFVIAPPFFQLKADQEYIKKMYFEVIEASPKPIGLYHRGKFSEVSVKAETLLATAQHPKVVMLKDSSSSPEDREILLKIKETRPELLLLNGLEFDNVPYLKAGYDGVLSGGACFTGLISKKIFELCENSQYEQAEDLQQNLNCLLNKTFGGETRSCWLAGQKYMMKKLGVFGEESCIINYQLTPECKTVIDELIESGTYELPFYK
jgi:4-hydroxy-tetrahydrodipicolinate synthase